MPYSHPAPSRRARWPACALPLLCLLAAACSTSEAAEQGIPLGGFERLDPSQVAELTLTRTETLQLGSAREGFVYKVSDFKEHDGEYWVVDGFTHSIKVFDRGGRLLRQIGREGKGPGEFIDPFEVAFGDGEIYVADPGRGRQVAVFDAAGRFVELRAVEAAAEPTAVAAAGDRLVVLGASIFDPRQQGWNIVSIAGRRGGPTARGCRLDPQYVSSRRRDGMIGRTAFGDVAVGGSRIYCIQTISPVVQVMDLDGRELPAIRVAPPFYQSPADRFGVSLNQKAIFDFLGSFTSHTQIAAVEGGFVSVYSRFDPRRGEVRYHLFACRTTPALRCGTARDLRKPVYIPSLDRVYVEEEVGPDEPMRLGVFRMAGLDGGAA